MCEDCGVDRYGEPIVDNWDPDDPRVLEKMRNWLVRLRQTALHFEVGGRNRRALRSKDAPLRTIEQVLEVMLDQSELSIRTAQRARLVNKLRRGQLLENGPRRMEALQIWTQALEESTGIVSELRDQLEMEVRSRVEPVDFESSEMANPKDNNDPKYVCEK
jgi:E3 ubiquitin-protein ligase SHPRH